MADRNCDGNMNVTAAWPIRKYKADHNELYFAELDDEVAVEYPLTVKLDGEEFATLVCTPSDLEDLIVGFLASEGVIRAANQIARLSIDEGMGFAYAELVNKHAGDYARQLVSKRVIGSCCGKSRQFYLASDVRTAKTVATPLKLEADRCFELMSKLQGQSGDFQKTGGVHNAALCTAEEILAVRADIGRHNALDKIYGHCLRNRISVKDKIIAFSGRVSSEVLLKTAKIGCGILLSKSAPTDLGLKLADDLGITVVGFIRNRGLNVYTHPERVLLQAD